MFVPALLLALVLAGPGIAQAGERVFVTNEKSDDVTVIDAAAARSSRPFPWASGRAGSRRARTAGASTWPTATPTASASSTRASLAVLQTGPAGVDPEGLALDRSGAALYVVNENELSVTVLDAATLAIVKKIEVGEEAETAVASPDGRWVAVSNETSNDVHVIDTASNTVVTKIPVPRNPRGMRFTPDWRHLWVACERADAVSIIDMTTMTRPARSADGRRAARRHRLHPRRPPRIRHARKVRRRARPRRGDARGGCT